MKSEFFSRREFACKCGCGFDTVDAELLEVLEDLRRYFCTRVYIISGCRCLKRNLQVNGSPGSKHMEGRAADMRLDHIDPVIVRLYLEEEYGDKYGIGTYTLFTHLDTRTGVKVRW